MIYVTTALHCHVNVYRWMLYDSKKRLAKTLKISHETTEHVCNNMCRQTIIQ